MKKKTHRIAKHSRTYRAITTLCLVLLFCAMPSQLVWPVEETKIYFYSCETNINNFKSLKMEWDRYFSNYGSFSFQPFTERKAFEDHIKDKKYCLIIMSSWQFAGINEEYALLPVLVGLRNGKKTQKRILVSTDDNTGPNILPTGPIASASSPDHTQSILSQMFNYDPSSRKLDVLTVPKDIDALMSVGFGMAKSALTSQSGFDQLQQINPKLFSKMKIIKESKASLSLILAVPKGFEPESEKMVTIIKNMANTKDGKEKISMLGLDGWQELNKSDHLNLEAK